MEDFARGGLCRVRVDEFQAASMCFITGEHRIQVFRTIFGSLLVRRIVSRALLVHIVFVGAWSDGD